MNTPKFSVIIPTYNAERSLRACLESILEQDYPLFEIIVIDGNSSDKTLQIIQDYSSLFSRLKYVSAPDEGIYDGMNKGIEMASGKWLYFLGSDDTLYDPSVFKNIAELIEGNQKSKIIYGNVFTSEDYIQSYPDHDYSRLLHLNICHQAIFYHRSLFAKFRYNLKYSICADWDLNLKVFRSPNFPWYTDTIIAKYNLQGASANWWQHPAYLIYFANKKKLILRYRSIFYLLHSYLMKFLEKRST